MKSAAFIAFVTALLLAACSQAPAPDTTTPATAGDKAMDIPASSQTPAPDASKAGAPAMAASASGTIESVDPAAGKITIAHGAVEALGWPAMTMAFNATPEQIASVKAGDKVHFEFESQGMEATISRIEPAH